MTSVRVRPVAAIILCALGCSTLAIAFGAIGTLTYWTNYRPIAGLTLQHLRPLHTILGVAWIYLGAAAVVYFYLFSKLDRPPRGFMLRLKAQLLLWGIAGLGIVVSLWLGIFSGREYMGAHWSWSVLIYIGWILFVWNFISVEGFSLTGKPVFIYMWYTGLFLFLYSFAEGHGWLLPRIGTNPVRDIALQWKSYGPLVGSFNLLIYGSLSYLACRLAGDDRHAYSNTAFALLFVGVLNTFTNFGHHTYHLPQSHIVKWISCIVSLTEAILVVKYLLHVLACFRTTSTHRNLPGVHLLITFASIWSFLLVGMAVIISVPPVNTLIHGTHTVVAHGMGSMLGIDSMILWAVLLYIIHQFAPTDQRSTSRRAAAIVFGWINLTTFLLVGLLTVKGMIDGYLRYMASVAPAPPRVLIYFPHLFFILGVALALGILWVNISWTWALTSLARRDRAQ